MVFAVNKHLAALEKIPHSLFWRGWNRVRNNYKGLYPRSSIYQLLLLCAVTVAAIAVAFVALRVWEYTHGRLPLIVGPVVPLQGTRVEVLRGGLASPWPYRLFNILKPEQL